MWEQQPLRPSAWCHRDSWTAAVCPEKGSTMLGQHVSCWENMGTHYCQDIGNFTYARDVPWELIALKCVYPKLKTGDPFSKWQGESARTLTQQCNQQCGAHVGHCNDITGHAYIFSCPVDVLLVHWLELVGGLGKLVLLVGVFDRCPDPVEFCL